MVRSAGGTGGKLEVLSNRVRGLLGELAFIGGRLPLLTELPRDLISRKLGFRCKAFSETGLPAFGVLENALI